MSVTVCHVKGQGHQAALLTAALMRQAAAAVTVGTYCINIYIFFVLRRPLL